MMGARTTRTTQRMLAWAGAVALLGGLQGCANPVTDALGHGVARMYYGDLAQPAASYSVAVPQADLIALNNQAVDALLQQAPLDVRQPLLVATLVHVDRLQESSRLGRMVSEQIATRMVQSGLNVTEVKLREHLVLQPGQGELLLSRQAREVSHAHRAQAVVVGTYAMSASVVYIHLKLVSPVGNTVMAAHSYSLPMDANVRALLSAY